MLYPKTPAVLCAINPQLKISYQVCTTFLLNFTSLCGLDWFFWTGSLEGSSLPSTGTKGSSQTTNPNHQAKRLRPTPKAQSQSHQPVQCSESRRRPRRARSHPAPCWPAISTRNHGGNRRVSWCERRGIESEAPGFLGGANWSSSIQFGVARK